MKFIRLAILAIALAIISTSAYAGDFNFGSYARSVGMGGAGLALTDDPSSTTVVNPAALAASGSKFRFIFPSLDTATQGATIDELRSRIDEIADSSTDEAVNLARDFGSQQTKLSVAVTTGFTGPLGVTLEGEAQGIINPGPQFKAWATAGGPTTLEGLVSAGLINDVSELPAYADSFTNGTSVRGNLIYSLPSVTYGTGISGPSGQLWVGTKVKWLHSEVHSWDITASASGTSINLDAVENPKIEDDGLAADIGLIYAPKDSTVQYGVVINNLLNPNLNGIDTQSMFSAGIAAKPNSRTTLVADLININKAYNENPYVRFGAEFKLTKSLAVRGGYSGTDWTFGLGAFGYNVAFAQDTPPMISRTLRF